MDKRIGAVKTASLVLFAAVALAIQAFTGHRHLTAVFDRIQRDEIAYLLMTLDRDSGGIELQMEPGWEERVGAERMRRVQAGEPDIEYPTGPVASTARDFPHADSFEIGGVGPLPDGRQFHFRRLKPGSPAYERGIRSWRLRTGAYRDTTEELPQLDLYGAWPVDDTSKRFSLVFAWPAPHGDSSIPVNAADVGMPLRATVGADREPLTASALRSRIVFSARDFAVSATDPGEAYRQADLQLRKERIRVPLLNVEVGYLAALGFLLLIATASLFSVSSNLRQLAAMDGTRTEPWMVLERTPGTGTPPWVRVTGLLEKTAATATLAAAILAGVAVGVLVCVATFGASPWFWAAAVVTALTVMSALSSAASLAALLRRGEAPPAPPSGVAAESFRKA
ncbi:MAG TPA: hypothetical protein VFJ82_19300 [Longimicrobium sp.]|nr:hypothetical protein [Longimicrobium sp.]